jgi:ATP-dependent DNA helicase RecG
VNTSASNRKDDAADLKCLRGVGPAVAERLAKLNIERPIDLLFLLPQRYEDRTCLTPLGATIPGMRTVVEGDIALTEVVFRRRRTLLVRIIDGTGQLTLRFFYFSRAQQTGLKQGAHVRCYGEVRKGPGGLEMIHPEYRVVDKNDKHSLEETLTPIYPTTEGLQQPRLRNLVNQAIDRFLPQVTDWIPQHCISAHGLPDLKSSILYMHRPPPDADLAALGAGIHACQRRLALEEMLAHHLSLRKIREQNRTRPAISLTGKHALRDQFLAALPFELTGDQRATLDDIDADLAGTHPMMRLVQGDVGCGKTVVAAAAALNAVAEGHQVAIMAPTELLGEQHRDSFAKWLTPLGITVAWLSGGLTRKAREQVYIAIGNGDAAVIIGTHALFQEGLDFHSLALVVVDEQHRFGVHQRLSLMEKGRHAAALPHQLVMTATPIPRTLAMTAYADLDTSVIRELPPGRQPIKTVALPEKRRAEIVMRARDACHAGQRAYWVCPLIEDSDNIESQAAESTHAMIAEALPDLSVGLVHGRMKSADKERAMHAFTTGKMQILVATSVIEVGVDVPEATLMIIENAERLGLSQLHQLRGRVGRGATASNCVLLYRPPLSAMAKRRIGVLRNTNDGFKVAQHDLELRGPGEVLGTRQTGLMQLRIADLIRDADLAPAVQKIATQLMDSEPTAVSALIRRWIGAGSRFGRV